MRRRQPGSSWRLDDKALLLQNFFATVSSAVSLMFKCLLAWRGGPQVQILTDRSEALIYFILLLL